jgi:predicted RNA-binding Zn-ribbon protein involved in translation (DUF1610 family)
VSDELRCPGCGQVIDTSDAADKGEADAAAPLTCPTCGAGIDRDGNLVHDPVLGP